MAPRRTKHYEITRPLPRGSISLRRCAETPKRRSMGMALRWHDPGVPKILDLGSRRVDRIGHYDGLGNLKVPLEQIGSHSCHSKGTARLQ